MNIAFYTLGCKVNQYETQSLREEFAKAGYNTVTEKSAFDIAVINSCTVTSESDRKTRQLLHRIRRENPDAVIILTGCMVQAFPQEAEKLDGADIITGNTDIKNIVALTERFLSGKKRIFEVEPHKTGEKFNTPLITSFAERTRAYMKIEDGCDRFCSYCVIPYARGRVRSKPVLQIRQEAEKLSENGFSEIVLTGINLSAYGKDCDLNLCDAVDAVCEAQGIKRVRLGSLEPDHISDEMLKRLKGQTKFCPQFHLSLQSGCDATLKRMNRHYDTGFYYDLITRIRKMFPQASITTDVMVGFAGETEDEFNLSLEFVRKAGFAKTHVFTYSRRKGTAAWRLPLQVDSAEKNRRSRLMISAAAEIEREFRRSKEGQVFPVLFETVQDGIYEGYTPNYSRVKVKDSRAVLGSIMNVKITDTCGDCCTGEIIF